MEAGYEYVRSWLVNFKLDLCCYLMPLSTGLFIVGYMNVILAYIWLIGIADESFDPLLVQVQRQILDDNATKPIPILAYATELAFSVVLLCAVNRRDSPLLRFYMLYCIGALVMSVLVYSLVVAGIGALSNVGLVISIVFQIYVIILVRSMIVEWKLEARRNLQPTIVYQYPIHQNYKPVVEYEVPLPQTPDPEVKHETSPEVAGNGDKSQTKDQDLENGITSESKHQESGVKSDVRLETVNESPKEESVNDKA